MLRLTPGEAQTDTRPNVVFILADDMRADDFEHMPQTRRLLAEEGVTFEEAFVTHSLCCPSRASILRRQYTHNHQVWKNARPEGGFEKFRSMGHEDSNVATWLESEGYQTALIGKYLNGYSKGSAETYVPPGWYERHAKLGGDGCYDYQMNENGTVDSCTNTDVLAGKARDYVRYAASGASSSPFFMYLTPATPHGPFVPAPQHEDAYADVEAPRPPSFDEPNIEDKPTWVRNLPRLDPGEIEDVDSAYRNRLEMLLSLDEMVASLVEELEATGELENTYVFFTSDNGYHLGEHRLNLGKRTVYEETARVPWPCAAPGYPPGKP